MSKRQQHLRRALAGAIYLVAGTMLLTLAFCAPPAAAEEVTCETVQFEPDLKTRFFFYPHAVRAEADVKLTHKQRLNLGVYSSEYYRYYTAEWVINFGRTQ